MMDDKMKAALDAEFRGMPHVSMGLVRKVAEWTINYLRSQQEPVGKIGWMAEMPGGIQEAQVDWRLPVGTQLYTYPIPSVPAVPEGWKMVPVKMTPEMRIAAFDACGLDTVGWMDIRYEAAISAAPSPTEKES